mgnify:CR=1 FL=1
MSAPEAHLASVWDRFCHDLASASEVLGQAEAPKDMLGGVKRTAPASLVAAPAVGFGHAQASQTR